MNWFDVYAKAALKETEDCRCDIVEGVDILIAAYRQISPSLGPVYDVDFNQSYVRAAYLYLYGPLHSHFVRDVMERFVLNRTKILQNFSKSDPVQICSIGGGPGSDVMGVREALLDIKDPEGIYASVFDLFQGWESTYYRGTWAAGHYAEKDNYYGNIDMMNVDESQSAFSYSQKVKSADIITMVKFFSVISHQTRGAQIFLANLTRRMKPGAIILYIDNSAGGFSERFSRSMLINSMKLLDHNVQRFHLDDCDFYDVFTNSLKQLKRLIPRDLDPCFSCSVCIQIWQKPDPVDILLKNHNGFKDKSERGRNNYRQTYKDCSKRHLRVKPYEVNRSNHYNRVAQNANKDSGLSVNINFQNTIGKQPSTSKRNPNRSQSLKKRSFRRGSNHGIEARPLFLVAQLEKARILTEKIT